jgi:hypothetical protein
MASIRETIEREVKGWPGVDARAHRFGGVEFRVNGHEIGHLHGDRMADLPFPVRMREELVESGKAQLHHVLPQTGWVSYYLSGEEDVAGALDLFKKNYDRLTAGKGAGAPGRAERRRTPDNSEVADPGKE